MGAPRAGQWLLVVAGVVIAAAVVAAIAVMGAPGVQRERRLDQVRIDDLTRIERAIQLHHTREDGLPADLAVLADAPGAALQVVDRQDGTPYGYRTLGGDAFELCATFARDTAERAGQEPWMRGDLDWRHPAGRFCFRRRVDRP